MFAPDPGQIRGAAFDVRSARRARAARGAEAGLLAACACYLAGFAGTATTLAGPRFGTPVCATMAHSFVQAHDDEAQPFADFATAFPANTVLLIDTYDTLEGARKAVAIAAPLAALADAVDRAAVAGGREGE